MPNTIIPYSEYEFRANKTYFFDNNIWIMLLAPMINSNEKKQERVTRFFKNIPIYNIQIALVSLVVSEFANTSMRFFFNIWRKHPLNALGDYKKDYKQSQDYRNNLEDVKVMLSKIYDFDFVQKYPDDFNAINSNHIIENFHIDYNDAYYLELCAKNDWILVTSDNDFDNIDKGITIVKI